MSTNEKNVNEKTHNETVSEEGNNAIPYRPPEVNKEKQHSNSSTQSVSDDRDLKQFSLDGPGSTKSPAAETHRGLNIPNTAEDVNQAEASSADEAQGELILDLQDLGVKNGIRPMDDGTPGPPSRNPVTSRLGGPSKSPSASYNDPTPKTPPDSRATSHSAVDTTALNEKAVPSSYDSPSEAEFDEKEAMPQEAPIERESQPEIDSIMTQFTDEAAAPRKDEIMSPRMELAGPMSGTTSQFPPRRSSLEPLKPVIPDFTPGSVKEASTAPPVPPKSPPSRLLSPSPNPSSPISTRTSFPPPDPEPEPDLPFDFHRFLEQLRHRTADPVAKFLRSFLTEFGKKQWMVHEQVKFIGDFLAFITNKMAQCEVWRDVSDAEFDNAKEGMEKLVMNRLYTQTFSPAIPLPPPPPRSKGKRKDAEKILGSGRRGQHQEDVERDEILAQKVRIYSWVREEHLDIHPVGPNGKRFLNLAQQELLKIKGYRAPRDKVICVLNCCKVIFGLLKNSKSSDTSADSFVPLLIYVVLQANPEHLVSNIQYILRFRNQDKLGGEAGYYMSSLSGAIQFIETLDRTSLTVSDEEFERNVEKAVSEIAERNLRQSEEIPRGFSEKSSLVGPEVTPRNSMDAEYASPRRQARPGTVDINSAIATSSSGGSSEDSDAVAGLLRTIQRPLSTIGRIFSDDGGTATSRGPSSNQPALTPQPGSTPRRLSPNVFQPPPRTSLDADGNPADRTAAAKKLSAEEAAARQASAETAEAQRVRAQEHRNVVETLYGMFPNLDRDIIDDVVRLKEGR